MIDEDDIYPIISITNESLSSTSRRRVYMHIDQTSILHCKLRNHVDSATCTN